MTMHSKEKITCECGHESDFDYYVSVNVDLDPKLKEKVLKKKINYCKCNKCGREQELVASFLYHDMKNRLVVWVLPESAGPGEEDELAEAWGDVKGVAAGIGTSQKIVRGYDELFKIINPKT